MLAPVAQWTEQQPSKLLIVGSNPARGALTGTICPIRLLWQVGTLISNYGKLGDK